MASSPRCIVLLRIDLLEEAMLNGSGDVCLQQRSTGTQSCRSDDGIVSCVDEHAACCDSMCHCHPAVHRWCGERVRSRSHESHTRASSVGVAGAAWLAGGAPEGLVYNGSCSVLRFLFRLDSLSKAPVHSHLNLGCGCTGCAPSAHTLDRQSARSSEHSAGPKGRQQWWQPKAKSSPGQRRRAANAESEEDHTGGAGRTTQQE